MLIPATTTMAMLVAIMLAFIHVSLNLLATQRRCLRKNWRAGVVPISRLFEGVGSAHNGGISQRCSHKLQPDWHIAFSESARHRDAWQTGEVDRDSGNVRQIHCQRVLCFFANTERNGRCNWRQQYIELLEFLIEFIFNQAPDLLRLLVVSIVIAGTQGVSAEHYSSLNFRTE